MYDVLVRARSALHIGIVYLLYKSDAATSSA